MLLEFTKEMPKQATRMTFDFSSAVGSLFFVLVVALLFPVSGTIVDNHLSLVIASNLVECRNIHMINISSIQ